MCVYRSAGLSPPALWLVHVGSISLKARTTSSCACDMAASPLWQFDHNKVAQCSSRRGALCSCIRSQLVCTGMPPSAAYTGLPDARSTPLALLRKTAAPTEPRSSSLVLLLRQRVDWAARTTRAPAAAEHVSCGQQRGRQRPGAVSLFAEGTTANAPQALDAVESTLKLLERPSWHTHQVASHHLAVKSSLDAPETR